MTLLDQHIEQLKAHASGRIHGLYLLLFENGIKVGRSGDLINRLKSYTRPWNRPVLEIVTFDTGIKNNPYLSKTHTKKLESLVLKRFSDGKSEFIQNHSMLEISGFIIEQDHSVRGGTRKWNSQKTALVDVIDYVEVFT